MLPFFSFAFFPSLFPTSAPSDNSPTHIVKVDFSDPPSTENTPFELKENAKILSVPGASFDALRIDSNGPYALIPGVDISPSKMPNCTLMIGLYLESIANSRGWVFGNEDQDYDRTILMHDSRFDGAISVALGRDANDSTDPTSGWSAWDNPQPPPVGEWIHVTAVIRQEGESYVFLNGLKSDRTNIGKNNDGEPDLWVGRPKHLTPEHWTDAWIKEVMVFDDALSDDLVAAYSENFLDSII